MPKANDAYPCYLRIVFSAMYLFMCLLLVALWVRSYTARDMARGVIGKNSIHVTSLRGQVAAALFDWPDKPFPWIFDSKSDKLNMVDVFPTVTGKPPLSLFGFRWKSTPTLVVLVIPCWFLILVAAAFSAGPWVSWRFSLRTLLLGVTLIAALFGVLAVSS